MKNNNQKFKYYKIISALTILLGVVLMTYMLKVESELGALPLALILVGAVGFMVSQIRFKKLTK